MSAQQKISVQPSTRPFTLREPAHEPARMGALRTAPRRSAAYASPAARPQAPATPWCDRAIRVLDVMGALAGLVLAAPVLAVLALLIARDGGPVLFGQIRVGRNGQGFRCLKLRSMAADAEARLASVLDSDPAAAAEWAASRKLKNDPRITRLGHFIRKTSLDELPQLWNVLKGDMSLVGPRPVVPDEIGMYGAAAADYMAVRPGLTGLWQVSGRSDCDYDTRIALDTEWTRSRSITRYLSIVLRTVPAVLTRQGAC